MKKSKLFITIIALLAMALGGCDAVLGFILGSDLMVEDVQVLYSGEEIAGLRINFYNDGVAVWEVPYVVVFSTDPVISIATDFVVYEDEIDFERNSEKIVDLSGSNDIQGYMELNAIEIPDGIYFLGVFIDPYLEFDEDSESNNEGVSTTDFEFSIGGGGGGGTELYADDFEPNDNFEQWADLFPDWNSANFHTPSDQDWFQGYQMAAMNHYIYARPGPDGLNVNVMVDVYEDWDVTMSAPVYISPTPMTNHNILIPDNVMGRLLRIHIYSPTEEIGEYEIWSDMNPPS